MALITYTVGALGRPLTAAEFDANIENIAAYIQALETRVTTPGAVVWRGDWNSSLTYSQGEGVTDAPKAYIALQTVPPGTATSDTDYWEPLSQGSAPVYVDFLIADWDAAVGGYHSMTFFGSWHLKETPVIQIFALDGTDLDIVSVDRVRVASNGDITIRVPDSPDGRFDGRIVIA